METGDSLHHHRRSFSTISTHTHTYHIRYHEGLLQPLTCLAGFRPYDLTNAMIGSASSLCSWCLHPCPRCSPTQLRSNVCTFPPSKQTAPTFRTFPVHPPSLPLHTHLYTCKISFLCAKNKQKLVVYTVYIVLLCDRGCVC